MRHLAYAAMLVFCLAFTLPLIPALKLGIFAHRRALVGAVAIAGVPFLIWDLWATHTGQWWFDGDQVIPVRLAGLPLEEIAFFVVIPLVSVITLEGVRATLGGRRPPWLQRRAAGEEEAR